MDDATVAPDALLYEKSIAASIERRDNPTQKYHRREHHQPGKGSGDIKYPFEYDVGF
jgi:hypothetical protein